jgi:glycosyltransferase involved in cell wall biosynthesis
MFFRKFLSRHALPAMTKPIFLSGTNGLPGRYGGWDQLLSHLADALSTKRDVVVHTSVCDATPGVTVSHGAKVDIIELSANGSSSILYDLVCLYRSLCNRGVCIMLGTSGGIFFPVFRLLGLCIILNPDGEEWNRTKWSKPAQLFLWFSDLIATMSASAVIADHPCIYNRIRKVRKTGVFCIPYGGDNALIVDLSEASDVVSDNIVPHSYIFGVCRIEPENNVHLCLSAASQLGLPLVFVGNWQRSNYGQTLYSRYSAFSNILLLDPIYDPVLLGSLRSNCSIYFHGHTVGGTNPSLVEALCLGLRIICHDNRFNRSTTDNDCTYFSDHKQLLQALSDLSSTTPQRLTFLREKNLAKYSWTSVVKDYEEVISRYA